MSSLVAIEKSYFEALPRRAGFDSATHQINLTHDVDAVTILRSEYEHLLRISQQFNNLKDSLLNGGVSKEDLDVLIYRSMPPSDNFHENNRCSIDKGVIANSHHDAPAHSRNPWGAERNEEYETKEVKEPSNRLPMRTPSNDYGIGDEDHAFSDGEKDDSKGTISLERPPATQPAQHTIVLRGFADRTTHHDIVSIIRGGAIFHVFLRPRDRMASVSFIEPFAAQDFMNHAKRHDIYILGKRVEVCWSERQFYLPPYVKAKADNGASRNLLIRSVNPNISEALIRKDLEHIHNLIIISVQFGQGNAYVSTNSVQNAMFARSCMMSRLVYKGTKIGYYPDECAGPLPKVRTISKSEATPSIKKTDRPTNRFQMLYLDGQNDSDDDEQNVAAGREFFGNNINLKSGSIAV